MARRLIPLLDRVLVQKAEAPAKSVGGILLPENASKVSRVAELSLASKHVRYKYSKRQRGEESELQVNEAQVVAVGPGRRSSTGDLIPVSVKEGDTVLLPEYGGQSVKLQETEYFLYRDDEVLGVLSS